MAFLGLPPLRFFLIAAILRKYSGPRFAVSLPPILPEWAVTIASEIGFPQCGHLSTAEIYNKACCYVKEKVMKKLKRRKRLTTPMEVDKVARNCGIPHVYNAKGGIEKLPAAAYKGCVLIPFHLASFIPKSAIRKFAANKPFVVEVHVPGQNSLSFYGRQSRLLSRRNVYRITFDPNPLKSKRGS